jgi:hypothetical protein
LIYDVRGSLGCHDQINLISNGDVLQSSKKAVAMPCDSNVALSPRHRRTNDSSNSSVQRQIIRPVKDWNPDLYLADLEDSQGNARRIQQAAFVGPNAFRRPKAEIDISIRVSWFRGVILHCRSLRVLKVPQCKSGRNLSMEQSCHPDRQEHDPDDE